MAPRSLLYPQFTISEEQAQLAIQKKQKPLTIQEEQPLSKGVQFSLPTHHVNHIALLKDCGNRGPKSESEINSIYCEFLKGAMEQGLALHSSGIHPHVILTFIQVALIPLLAYPLLNVSRISSSLKIILKFLKTKNPAVIDYFLELANDNKLQLIPSCLEIMKSAAPLGNEVKSIATEIINEIISHDDGLNYICEARKMIDTVLKAVANLVVSCREDAPPEVLRQIMRFYNTVVDHPRCGTRSLRLNTIILEELSVQKHITRNVLADNFSPDSNNYILKVCLLPYIYRARETLKIPGFIPPDLESSPAIGVCVHSDISIMRDYFEFLTKKDNVHYGDYLEFLKKTDNVNYGDYLKFQQTKTLPSRLFIVLTNKEKGNVNCRKDLQT